MTKEQAERIVTAAIGAVEAFDVFAAAVEAVKPGTGANNSRVFREQLDDMRAVVEARFYLAGHRDALTPGTTGTLAERSKGDE